LSHPVGGVGVGGKMNVLLMTILTLAIKLMSFALTLASAFCPKVASLLEVERPTVVARAC
jgi:hypothetical protein